MLASLVDGKTPPGEGLARTGCVSLLCAGCGRRGELQAGRTPANFKDVALARQPRPRRRRTSSATLYAPERVPSASFGAFGAL